MEEAVLGVILAILAAIIFGIGNTIARVSLQSIKTTSGTILSLLASLVVALIIAFSFEFKALISVSLIAIGLFALTGIFHFTLGRAFLYQSMRYIGAARGTSITQVYPLFALVFAVVYLKETLTMPLVVGTLLIIGGAYLLLIEGSKTNIIKKKRILGYCFGLASAVCWGATTVLIKYSSQFGPPFVVLSFALISGIMVLSVVTGRHFEIGLKTNRKAISLMLLAGFLNGIALVCFYNAVAMAPVVVVAPLAATAPLFTLLCVHLFIKRLERITFQVIIACFLVVVGGVLVAIY